MEAKQIEQEAQQEIKQVRIITDDQIRQYSQMVESWIRNSVAKNWRNEADLSKSKDEVALGNSGWTMADMRQYLFTEVFIALRNYKDDQGTKESTFVYGHLSNRVGSLMKKLTKQSKGYGVWSSNIEEVLGEVDSDD